MMAFFSEKEQKDVGHTVTDYIKNFGETKND